MKRKFYIISWVILGILFLGMYWLTRDNEPKKITSSNKTEKVVKNSDGSSRANKVLTRFENDIKKAGIFDKFEYNTENNVYIISKDINSMFSNKKGIEFFNISIKQLLDRNIVADKDVVFRGFDGNTTASIVYFTKDNFNKNWNSQNILDTDIYTKSNGWMAISKFGQHLTSSDKADNNNINEKLFNIFQLSKEK